MIIVKCFFMIGIATMPMLFPLIDDIRRDLNVIQQSLNNKTKRSKMAKPVAQFVQFHSETRQLSLQFFSYDENQEPKLMQSYFASLYVDWQDIRLTSVTSF